MDLLNFQKRFLKGALAPGVDSGALSIPRGNGKSALAAEILTKALTPGHSLHVPGAEYLLCAASLEQARIVFRFIRHELEPTGLYRFLDSTTKVGIVGPRDTRLKVLASNGKTAMGIVGCPLLVADEPGAWEAQGGTLMNDAIETAKGKPGSDLRTLYIGTLAPATGGWWHEMIEDGSNRSTYVQALTGNLDRWDTWPEIRRCNPLTAISAKFRAKLLEERDAARGDSRLKARFLSYRLNIPSADESTMLLDVADWQRTIGREVPDRDGGFICAIDQGQGRAWSAATAIWRNGRVECLAVAPGIPSLEAQEKRDRVSPGTYRNLYDRGLLTIAEGLRVQQPSQLWAAIQNRWGIPNEIICDRVRYPEFVDNVQGVCEVKPRRTRWSEAAEDVRAVRQMAKDGPLAVLESDRPLLATSLMATQVKNDDQGSFRISKSSNNTSRDDVSSALALVCGAYQRAMRGAETELQYVVVK